MAIEFSFVATPDLGPKALAFLLWRRGGLWGPLAIIAFPLLLVVLAFEPEWRWASYVLGGAAIMLFVIFLLAVAHRRRLRRRFFQSAADRTVKVIMGDEGVSVSTALGASTIPWRAIERVWEGRSVVLLFYHGWQYVAFPIDAMPRAALEFASQRVASRRNTTGV